MFLSSIWLSIQSDQCVIYYNMLKKIGNILIKSFFSTIKAPHQISVSRDPYHSLHLHCNQLIEQQKFKIYLKSVIKEEQNQDHTKAVWVHIEHKNLIHTNFLCNQLNFKIHHGVGNRISFSKWVSPKSDLIPPFSNFYVSCGAIVINDDHVLMVQQKNGPRKNCFGIPGGRSDCGQTLQQTAQRQLVQQTGIVAKFNYFLFFREVLNTAFGANDIYFGCVMKYEKQALKNLKICNRQLASYQWVHLSKLEKFIKQKGFGTQYHLGKYANDLYNSGFDFNNLKEEHFPNQTIERIVNSPDKIQRKFVQHRLAKLVSK